MNLGYLGAKKRWPYRLQQCHIVATCERGMKVHDGRSGFDTVTIKAHILHGGNGYRGVGRGESYTRCDHLSSRYNYCVNVVNITIILDCNFDTSIPYIFVSHFNDDESYSLHFLI